MSEEENKVQEESKQNRFLIYKNRAALVVENWLFAGKIGIKIAEGVEGKSGSPKQGVAAYKWNEAINIGFSYLDMLKFSFKLTSMAYGDESITYTKFADLSKVQGKDLKGQKKLHVAPSSYTSKGKEVKIISVNLSLDDKKVSIALDYDEAYALAKHLEFTYQYALNNTLKNESGYGKDK